MTLLRWLALVLIAGVGALLAQTAEITGRLTDSSGAVVPGVRVTAIPIDTGLRRETTSNETGYYTLPNLAPGRYELDIQASGFKPLRRTGITLAVQQVARIDLKLDLGTLQETVEVNASAPLVESSNAALGHVIDNKKITDLPLNGRQFLEYALLGAGVNRGKPGDVRSSQQGIAISANGLYTKNNNFMLDGADNNESFQNQFVSEPSVDAIAEFKVQTSLYSAEFGRGGGAVINVVTKSGTNQFHGTVFHFLRNNVFDAKNYFVPAGSSNPPLRRNQFGASLGGPVVRNRTHFFVNYDGMRLRLTNTSTALVPTAAQRAGDLSSLKTVTDWASGAPFPGNIIPASRISPVSSKLIGNWPAPNLPDTVRNYISDSVDQNQHDIGLARVDHRFSDKDSIYGRIAINDNTFLQAGPSSLVGGIENYDRNRSAVINWLRVVSPTTLNSLSLGFNRFVQDSGGQNVGNPIALDAGITGISTNPRDIGFPEGINFSAGTGFLSLGERAVRIRRVTTYQVLDSLSFVRGKHTLKAGGEIRYVQANILQTAATQGSFNFNGQYTGNGFAEFLLGVPSSTSVSVNVGLAYPRRWAYAGYLQDDWKITPDLTLNLGVRYEVNAPTTDARGQLSSFDYQTGEIVFPRNANLGNFYTVYRPDIPVRQWNSNTLFDTNWKNVDPRVGLAYRLFGSSKTVFRAGFGVFAMSPELNSEMNTGNTPPFQLRIDDTGNAGAPNLSWALKGDPALLKDAAFGIFTFNANRDFVNGYIMQWTGEIQQQLPSNSVFKIGYVGNKGVHIDQHVVRNQKPPGPGPAASRRDFSQFARLRSYESNGWVNYHSLQVSFEKRYSQGLNLTAAYTWSKSMDFGWTQDACCQQDIDNLAAENGLSSQDQRHRFTANALYELPFGSGKRFLGSAHGVAGKLVEGWRIGTIATLQSGFPVNPAVSGNRDNVPDNTDRPDRIGNGMYPSDQRSPDHWFDPAAFAVPALYTFGSSGRNVLTAPGVVNFDLVAAKFTTIGENRRLEFRAEFFNVTNTPNFGAPVANISSTTFGKIFSAAAPRQIQLGLKFYF
jgi:hypothetical protein